MLAATSEWGPRPFTLKCIMDKMGRLWFLTWCFVVLCCVVLCCVLLCRVVLCCVVLCCVVLCCVVLCCVVLCCVVLCCVVLYCAVLCCVVLYDAMFFVSHDKFHLIILHHTIPSHSNFALLIIIIFIFICRSAWYFYSIFFLFYLFLEIHENWSIFVFCAGDSLQTLRRVNQRGYAMRLIDSATVLCMPGLGFDTYRVFESLIGGYVLYVRVYVSVCVCVCV